MKVSDQIFQGKPSILKSLSSRERSEAEAVSSLEAEADLLARLGGEVTPRLLARGTGADGPWFVAEKIALPTLAAFVDAHGAAPVAWVERATTHAFEALAILHDARDEGGALEIVHADLSPANLAVATDASRVVFFDLELARWRCSPPRDGAFRGTLLYAAPEVARGEVPSARSDLFSLAATLLLAVLGRAPRASGAFPAVLAAVAEEPLRTEAIAALASRGRAHAALVACLAHDPTDRPAAAREVVRSILC